MYLSLEEHEFTQVYCGKCGDKHVIIKPCKYRYCPACGHISRWRVRERLHQVFKLMKHDHRYRLKMLTLSRQNMPVLKEAIDELTHSFRKLRQSQLWNQSIAGGLFVLEITGSPGSWHPHLHCFIYSLRIGWQPLRDRWSKASRGGTAVWIANVSNDQAIDYVTKYVTKFNSDPESAFIVEKGMKGRRMFQRFGSFHYLKLTPYLSGKKCDKCGCTSWVTEWDLVRLGIRDGDHLRALAESSA